MKIKKGDTVTILRGKDAGRTGKVLSINSKKAMAIVEDVNKVKKHIKKQSADQPGGIVEIEKPLPLSSLKKKAEVKTTQEKTKKSSTKKTTKKSTKTSKK
jgi:large subunit ribosomal protein L24